MKFNIRPAIKNKRKYHRVQWQRDGVRKERNFRTMQDARNFVEQLKRELAEYGHAGNLPPDKRADALNALSLMEKEGVKMSLTKAVEIAMKVQGKNIPTLAEAFVRWLAVKNSEGHSLSHRKEIKRRVGEFVALFAKKDSGEGAAIIDEKGEKNLVSKRPSEITTDDVDYFLRGLKTQRNTFRAWWT